jgi:hypothetical protein
MKNSFCDLCKRNTIVFILPTAIQTNEVKELCPACRAPIMRLWEQKKEKVAEELKLIIKDKRKEKEDGIKGSNT